jgi:GntR family transcriptional regulator
VVPARHIVAIGADAVDRGHPSLLSEQVAAHVRRAIADGEASPGDRLPLVKDIAATLGVNRQTVLRAMHVLRDEGMLEFRRGQRITVAGTAQLGAVFLKVLEVMKFARRQGYGREDVISIIEALP